MPPIIRNRHFATAERLVIIQSKGGMNGSRERTENFARIGGERQRRLQKTFLSLFFMRELTTHSLPLRCSSLPVPCLVGMVSSLRTLPHVISLYTGRDSVKVEASPPFGSSASWPSGWKTDETTEKVNDPVKRNASSSSLGHMMAWIKGSQRS